MLDASIYFGNDVLRMARDWLLADIGAWIYERATSTI